MSGPDGYPRTMQDVGRQVAREIRAMTRKEVIVKAIDGQLTWLQAADILGLTPRHLRRLKRTWEQRGYDGLQDQRGRTPRRRRIPVPVIARLCRLRRERYPDFSIQHFWEKATEQHGFQLSYTWTRLVLQAAGLAPKAPGRGRYRRQRERRPMIGMLVHLDGSTHPWIPGLPPRDLIVALDDADGRILSGRFWDQESTASTFHALDHVLRTYGRFAVPSRPSASGTSAPAPRKPGAAVSGTSGRSRAASPRSSAWRGLPTTLPPTRISPRPSSPTLTAASRSSPRSPPARSCALPGSISASCSRASMNAWCATTTP